MSMVNWPNPYADRDGDWLKGALHIHTNNPDASSLCGKVAPERMIELYKEAGYDFITLSDHLAVNRQGDPDLIMIPGMEWNSDSGEHTGVYAPEYDTVEAAVTIDTQVALLASMENRDALTVLNHPEWQSTPHYRREVLADKTGYDGLEIYNLVLEHLDGEAVATGKWDYVLSRGQKVLGFTGEDAHWDTGIRQCFNMVRAREKTVESVFGALKAGNFYCSSGVIVTDIRREGNTFSVETEGGQEIQVIGNGGKRLAKVDGEAVEFSLDSIDPDRVAGVTYIRFAVYGQGSQMAWTQPFFI